MSIDTTLPITDVSSVTIDGVAVEVTGSTTYNLNTATFERLVNTNGFSDTLKRQFNLGKIELEIRASNTFNTATLTDANSVKVVVVLNDGKIITGTQMTVEGPVKKNTVERTISVTFTGPNIKET